MEIRYLKKDEFYELRELLDGVFGRRDNTGPRFKALFPRFFSEPNDYLTSSHLGAFEDGKLIGTAAVYPLDYVVGGEHIKLIANGNIAVLEEYQGKGVMSRLNDAVNAELDKMGCDFGYLHGKPERYGRWGYLQKGIQYELIFNPTELNGYEFVKLDDSHVDFCRELSQKKVDYIIRKREDFEPALRSGNREAIAVTKNGIVKGFISLKREWGFVEEFGFDGEIEAEVFGALGCALGRTVKVRFSGYDLSSVKRLEAVATEVNTSIPALFRIINEDRVREVAKKLGLDESVIYAPYLT